MIKEAKKEILEIDNLEKDNIKETPNIIKKSSPLGHIKSSPLEHVHKFKFKKESIITPEKYKTTTPDTIDSYTVKIDDMEFNVYMEKKNGRIFYTVPEVYQIMDVLSKLSEDNINEIKSDISDGGFQKISEIYGYLMNYFEKYDLNFKNFEIQILAKYFYLILGKLGLLEIPINDSQLEEIMVNGDGRAAYIVHRKYQMCKTNLIFDKDELNRIIENIALLAGRTIDSRTPMLDAFLPDGSRVNATTEDVTPIGYTLTIRKFSSEPLTIIDLINYGTFNFELAAFLWQAVEGYFGAKPANTLIVGGTGSGKTTTLNVISMFSMYTDRIVTIEDTPELQIPHDHVIKMITRPPRPGVPDYEITMDDLIKNALRMRPDRIFVGEVRGEEAHSLLVAMNTGHDGALIGKEPIYLSHGKTIGIGDFVDGFFDKYEDKVKEDNGFEWIDISKENIHIHSFNKKSLKIEDKLISHVWRKEYSGKLLKIKTEMGRGLTLTHDHPLYILKNIIFEVNANRVKVGDYIAHSKIHVNKNSTITHIKYSLNNYYNILNNYYNLYSIYPKDSLYGNFETSCEGVAYNHHLNSNIPYIDSLIKNISIISSDICWDKVISIEEIDYSGYIYDITVKDNHTYIAGNNGGIIVSNCSGTLHANSASEAISRLTNPPMNVPKIMLSSLDFIINQQRIKRNRKTVRRILSVIEISGSGEDISKTSLFTYDGTSNSIRKEGICMWEDDVCNIAGISRDELMEDRLNRIEVLKYALRNNIRDINSVGNLIRRYQENPEEVLKNIVI